MPATFRALASAMVGPGRYGAPLSKTIRGVHSPPFDCTATLFSSSFIRRVPARRSWM